MWQCLSLSLQEFQSHLYGIERQKKIAAFNAYVVSIAPLWNWKSSQTRSCKGSSATFQSHLYGIESRKHSGFRLPKSKFQSHLYGIESSVGWRLKRYAGVSIAPLWNWKSVQESWSSGETEFQSHLYGIERTMEALNPTQPRVSIAPLWNWKQKLMGHRTKRICFNRTFMELKVATNREYA